MIQCPEKKTITHQKLDDKKTKETFLSGIVEKKLITKTQDSVLCEIANVFDDQFHYSLTLKDDKLEIFYSPNIKKVTGYKPEELVKLKSLGREMVYEEDLSDVKKKLYKIETGKVSSVELLYRYVRKDGNIIWLKEQIKAEKIRGQKILKGLVIDVSNLKKVES